jgi:AbrB family looped-hinge helix DNA binding protein
MKATGIVRRIDDLGRVVIPKEIRRTMRIREGDPSLMTLEPWERFCGGMLSLGKRMGWERT